MIATRHIAAFGGGPCRDIGAAFVAGARYNAGNQQDIDTEDFVPLH
jgi:hypothetical protein